MSEKVPQTFANHSKIVPLYHYALGGILIANFGMAVWALVQAPGLETGRSVMMAVGYFLIYAYLRLFPLAVQDRLIKLEMKLRLRHLLKAEDYARVDQLKRHHFVALRFAPDNELPELYQRVLAGELRKGKEIKAAIKSWNPDYQRC